MPKRSPDGPQLYVEAFPGLDVLAVERAVRAGRLLCEWVDEAGRVVGHARVLAWSANRLEFEHRFGHVGVMLSASGRRTVEIVREHRVKSHNRPSWLCRACGKHVGKLFLVWEERKCRKCHDICYISQRAAPIVRKLRRHDYLRRRLDPLLDSFETPRERAVAEREFGELAKAVVNSRDYEIPRPVSAMLFGEWISPGRRPALMWDVPMPEARSASVAPEVRATPTPVRVPTVAVWWGGMEEDDAEDGFPRSSRFG